MPFWHRAASLPLAILPSHPYLAPSWIVRTFSNTQRPPKRLALNVLVYLFSEQIYSACAFQLPGALLAIKRPSHLSEIHCTVGALLNPKRPLDFWPHGNYSAPLWSCGVLFSTQCSLTTRVWFWPFSVVRIHQRPFTLKRSSNHPMPRS